mmetsp:Transcript_19170/g.28182  ORF Transcript_19170/g.28182 Transcript_19170/m.28182 type:complete len:710 (-) Transcript_19170:136-2265(-)
MRFSAIATCLLLSSLSNASAFTTNVGTKQQSIVSPFSSKTTLSNNHVARPRTTTSLNGAMEALSSISTSTPEAVSTSGVMDSHLMTYFLETLITVGVPALIYVIAAALSVKFIVGAMGGGKRGRGEDEEDMRFWDGEFGTPVDELYDDLYSDGKSSGPSGPAFLNNFKKPNKSPRNMGIPSKQYIKVTNLNEKFSSYRYSLTAATKSKSYAAAELRSTNFNNAITKSLNSSPIELSSKQQALMVQTEKSFLNEGKKVLKEIVALQRALTQDVIMSQVQDLLEKEENEEEDDGIIDAEVENVNTTSTTNATSSSDKKAKKKKSSNKDLFKKIEKKNTELLQLELDFIAALIEILGLERVASIRRTLLGNINSNGAVAGALLTSLQDRPLSTVLASLQSSDGDSAETTGARRKSLYITAFPGDVTASQVAELREEVTAIIRSSNPGDEALLVLQSGGGTVTGYGLAAAQLQRFKEHNMKLTICVEQVAASGGYMMCCVADHVVASPFAVLGSIGVISDIPNVYERLKQEGIEFQTVTAGKYKRTLTPTKKVTKEDLAKSKEDIEDILSLFKGFVKENRPQLDIDSVATGETWFGTDALSKGLCDEIGTADDVLLSYIDQGYDVYDVKYEPEPELTAKSLLSLPVGKRGDRGENVGLGRSLIRSLVRTFADEVVSTMEDVTNERMMGGVGGAEKRYMMKDPSDVANRIRMED